MATTQQELDLAFLEVGTRIKGLLSQIGSLTSLSTQDKSNLVNAISEVKNALATAGAQINDAQAAAGTVYSSSKTDSQIASARAALKAEILGGASSAYDTLQELVDFFNNANANEDNQISALLTGQSNRLRFDAAQTLTDAQKAQANANAGALALAQFGDPTHSYKTVFVNALS